MIELLMFGYKRHLQWCLVLLCLIIPSIGAVFANEKSACIKFVDADVLQRDPNNRYFAEVLEAALSKSADEYGDYALCPLQTIITQKRQLLELEKGKVDVFWTITTKEREDEALAITIPLAFGVYGLRVLVVNKSALQSRPETLLKRPMLVGADWPDRQVLETNGMIVDATHSEHDLLFLTADRDLYVFPRGITEAWAELTTTELTDLAVDTSWLLRYPAAMYFFVAHDNLRLANRIRYGLEKMTINGELWELFIRFSWHREMLKKAKLGSRQVVSMKNPTLPNSVDKNSLLDMQQRVISQQAN